MTILNTLPVSPKRLIKIQKREFETKTGAVAMTALAKYPLTSSEGSSFQQRQPRQIRCGILQGIKKNIRERVQRVKMPRSSVLTDADIDATLAFVFWVNDCVICRLDGFNRKLSDACGVVILLVFDKISHSHVRISNRLHLNMSHLVSIPSAQVPDDTVISLTLKMSCLLLKASNLVYLARWCMAASERSSLTNGSNQYNDDTYNRSSIPATFLGSSVAEMSVKPTTSEGN